MQARTRVGTSTLVKPFSVAAVVRAADAVHGGARDLTVMVAELSVHLDTLSDVPSLIHIVAPWVQVAGAPAPGPLRETW